MNLHDERNSFLEAIQNDPYDLQTRKVFADWLDEFGTDVDADLAAEQRAWTKEKQDAIVWLEGFAHEFSLTYDALIHITKSWLQDTVEGFDVDMTLSNLFYSHQKQFWHCFTLATGIDVDETHQNDTPFYCSC